MKTVNIIRRNWTRRNLLSTFTRSGAAAALAPFIPVLEAGAADKDRQYFFWWYTGQYDNSVRGYYHTLGLGDNGTASFPAGSPFVQLNDWTDKFSLIQGLNNKAAPQSGGGGPHRRGAMTGITGTNLVNKKGGDPDLFKGKTLGGTGDSLDQMIARDFEARGIQMPFRSLHVGWHFNSKHLGERSFSYWKKQPQTIEQNPQALFNRLFKAVGAGQDSGGGISADDALRVSILDYARDSLKRINNKISVDDRVKMDAHLTSIEELEKRLTDIQNGAFSCGEITELQNMGVIDRNDVAAGLVQAGMKLDALTESFFDLLAIAFNCDLTRVATFQFSRGTDDHVYSFLSEDVRKFPGDFHGYTHNVYGTQSGNIQNSPGDAKVTDRIVTAAVKWRTEQFTRFMKKLNDVSDGDTSTLDKSALLWWGDVSEAHDFDKLRWIVAGSANGRFKNGVRTTHGNKSHNILLNTLTRAFGVDKDIGTYEKGAKIDSYLL